MKQEHREEIDLSSVPSLPVPHPTQSQRSPSDAGHPCDGVLSAQRDLVCPIQQTYESLITSSHLTQLQCRDESSGKEQHMIPSSVIHQPFQVVPSPVASSYQPMQSNVVYNGPSCLPSNAASSQEFDAVLFQQDAALPSLINLGCQPPSSIPFHSSNSSSAGHLLAHSPHSVQTLPHLPSAGYHCSNTGQRSLSSPVPDQVTGQPSPQLQPITYSPSRSGSAATASPTASGPLASSPLSGPPSPSPQLQPMPYQNTSSGTASSPSLTTRMHSGQHSTQAQSTGQRALSPSSTLICHNLCDPVSFPPDESTVNIKPDPEEPNFSTIGLQDITLDDGRFFVIFLK